MIRTKYFSKLSNYYTLYVINKIDWHLLITSFIEYILFLLIGNVFCNSCINLSLFIYLFKYLKLSV